MNYNITKNLFFTLKSIHLRMLILFFLSFTSFIIQAQDPGAPTGLSISNVTSTGFTLTWDAQPTATGTNIFIVDPAASSGDVYITTVAAGVNTFDYSGTYGSITIQDGVTYLAKIQPLLDPDFNNYADTSVTTAAPTADPGAPTGLATSNITSTGFTLTWDADPNATGGTNIFIVDPAASSGDVYVTTVAAGVNTFDYSGTYGSVTIQDGVTYIAKIQALPDADFNAYADVSVTTGGTPPPVDPGTPTGLTISNVTATGFTLTWDADPLAINGTNIFIVDPAASSGDIYITTVAAGVNTFDYSGTYGSVTIQDGMTYLAKIQALPDADFNAYADISVTASTPPPPVIEPGKPTGLSISNITSSGFTLTWDTDPLATNGTNIFIADPVAGSGDVFITTVAAGINTFDYTGTYGSITIQNGVTYLAKIQALPDTNSSAFADIEITARDISDPETPTGLQVSTITATSFTISWDADANATEGFNVFITEPGVSSEDIFVANIPAGSTSFDFSGTYESITIQDGRTYLAKIQALPDANSNALGSIEATLPECPAGNTMSLYPIPATDIVNVLNHGSSVIKKMTLTNTNGEIIKISNDAQLNINDVVSGYYFVIIEDQNRNKTVRKVVKQ
ncbi:T9SS type A sorting domain-containing protein [Aquimarina algiphila]|uniref:T9SS type A sorting domain-containing protein n=1 Tax=Aquimarina algiphila TaxID=2047982 RepID=UPI0024932E78|nr:T9SS type A sorting domain-containing protein [Aquimarina algiphila]